VSGNHSFRVNKTPHKHYSEQILDIVFLWI